LSRKSTAGISMRRRPFCFKASYSSAGVTADGTLIDSRGRYFAVSRQQATNSLQYIGIGSGNRRSADDDDDDLEEDEEEEEEQEEGEDDDDDGVGSDGSKRPDES
jgi:hypothetical protein